MSEFNFFQRREFGENISFSLQFFKQNFKHYFLTQYVLTLPIWIGMAAFFYFAIDNFRDAMRALNFGRGELSVFLFYAISIVVGCYFLCIGYNYHILYMNKGTKKFGYQEVLGGTVSTYGRALIAYIAIAVCSFVISMIAALVLKPFGSDLGAFILLVMISCLLTYLAFMVVAAVHQRLGVVEAAKRSIMLVKNNWWKTFGVFVVVIVLSYLLLYIANVILFFILSFTVLSFRSFANDLIDNKGIIIVLLVFIFSLSANIMGMIINTTTFVVYGSLVEEKDGVNLKDKAEKLGTTLDNEKDEEDF